MTQLRTIFETCRPRADVEAGTTKDEQFAADLAQVVNRTAPKEYADPAVFFGIAIRPAACGSCSRQS